MGWSVWLRAQVVSLGWAAYMYAAVAENHTVFVAVVHLAGGLLLGLLLGAALRAYERTIFGDLTEAERETVVAAVRAGAPPGDPRLAEAAARLARRWATPGMRPAHQMIFFGFFVLLAAVLGIFVTPWAWLGVPFWVLVARHSMRTDRRRLDAGRRFLGAR